MDQEPTAEIAGMIRRAYDAFSRRDIDGALLAMTTDVAWANGWEGGYVHGHDAVRDYWTRQWERLDPYVTAGAMTVADDGRVVVAVDQEVRDRDGALLAAGQVHHAYTLRGALVARMDIIED